MKGDAGINPLEVEAHIEELKWLIRRAKNMGADVWQLTKEVWDIGENAGYATASTIDYLYRRIERAVRAVKSSPKEDYPYKPSSTEEETDNKTMANQSNGNTMLFSRRVYRRKNKFKLSRLMGTSVGFVEQQLGVRDNGSPYNWNVKHLVSEYGQNGGYMGICMDSSAFSGVGCLPMHVYDLNLFVGSVADNGANYGTVAVAGSNGDINARAWVWKPDNEFAPFGGSGAEARWYVNDAKTPFSTTPTNKVFRKGIKIDFNVYGCTKMPTQFKIDVIKCMDPKMCPDYPFVLTGDELLERKQNWQNLTRADTVNPVLRSIEPGPKPNKKWFRIVASKRISMPEQTTDVDRIPSVQSRITLNLNESVNYAWTDKDMTVESGTTVYDQVPLVEASDANVLNAPFKYLPYYTSRYYLVIRALSPVDNNVTPGTNKDSITGGGWSIFQQNGVDITKCTYQPSYDLAIRSTFMTVNAF